jgi:hypothetical protein
MTFTQRRELAARLRDLPLERVLPLCGGRPDHRDHRQWHTPAGTLSVTGAKFMNWTLGTGGGGAIDLVIHLCHLDFKGAVDWLAGHFSAALPPEPQASPPPSELRLPRPAPNQLARVRDYLIAARHLPTGLVAALIDSGTLYADARTNAVFLLRDDLRLPVGAELRGTTATPWHGLAPGSRKDLGCFAIPVHPPQCCYGGRVEPRSTVVLCESAIDAISCFVLHPAYRCLSTAGARPEPRWLRPLLEQGCQVYCGFDADLTGDAMADAMITRYPRVQRLRPTRHDWNDVLKARA